MNELQAHYAEQPHEVSLETFAHCNAACTFCPYTTLERLGTKLPEALIDRLIDEMAGFAQPFFFSPFKVNEPLLDKRLLPILRTFNAKVPQGVIRLFSNGSTLTQKNLDNVAQLQRVAHLWVSLNEHRPQAYTALMGLDFEHTAKNLDRLHAMDFPHEVMVSRVGVNHDFHAYVQKRWPKFKVFMIKKDAWIDFTQPDVSVVPDTPCSRWWELNITATGQAALCCMDGRAEYGFGNVHEQTLLEIYNHPTLKGWRDRMASRRTVGKPCHGCSY